MDSFYHESVAFSETLGIANGILKTYVSSSSSSSAFSSSFSSFIGVSNGSCFAFVELSPVVESASLSIGKGANRVFVSGQCKDDMIERIMILTRHFVV